MDRKEKSLIIASLIEKFKQYNGFYILDATKLSVSAVNQFKRSCQQAGVAYAVFKNTLIVKALEAVLEMRDVYQPLREQVLKGFSGILFFNEDASIPAKLIEGFRRSQNFDRPLLKGAYVDGDLLVGDANLEKLSRYKSQQALIGEIITLLQSPLSNMLLALQNKTEK
jgi:large subunit ribosomal protein L10